jgi:hypothetical protein
VGSNSATVAAWAARLLRDPHRPGQAGYRQSAQRTPPARRNLPGRDVHVAACGRARGRREFAGLGAGSP